MKHRWKRQKKTRSTAVDLNLPTGRKLPGVYEAHVEAFAEIYRVIDEEIPADHIIDTTAISGIPEYFHDHIHPTIEGSQAIAKIIADALTSPLRRGDPSIDPR